MPETQTSPPDDERRQCAYCLNDADARCECGVLACFDHLRDSSPGVFHCTSHYFSLETIQ